MTHKASKQFLWEDLKVFSFMRLLPLNTERKLNVHNPFSVDFTKWWNTFKQFVGNLPTNCLSVSDYFVGLAPKRISCSKDFLSDFWTTHKRSFYVLCPGGYE